MTYIKNAIILFGAICLIGSSIDLAVAGSPSRGGSSSSGSSSHSSGSSSHSSGSSSHSSGSSSHSSGSSSHSSGSSGYSKPSSSGNSNSSHTAPSTPSHGDSSHTTPNSGSSNGYTKPGNSTSGPTTPSPSTSTYSKPFTPPSSAPKTSPPTTSLGAASTKGMSQESLKSYQAERAAATKPPQPVHSADVKNNPARSTYQNNDQYMNKRTTIINNYNSTYSGWGSMGYGMHPNYGMWSNQFLTGMIMGYVGTSLLSNSMWMYSHMHEPWYPSYRADLEAQAANNAELKSKLAAMDVEVAKLKAQNAQPQQQNTLPSGVDPALAIAPEVMMANDEHDGMSWWWAPVFVLLGIGAAWMFVKIIK